MELIATPYVNAISSISGAAVPEEILSVRVCARACSGEHAGPTHSCNAGCIQGSGMRHGDGDAANIPAKIWAILKTGRGSQTPIETGGQSHLW